jgi:hypothetical protein
LAESGLGLDLAKPATGVPTNLVPVLDLCGKAPAWLARSPAHGVAPGLNAVIVQDKLEIGAVYWTPIATQHSFNFNEVIVKAVLRF